MDTIEAVLEMPRDGNLVTVDKPLHNKKDILAEVLAHEGRSLDVGVELSVLEFELESESLKVKDVNKDFDSRDMSYCRKGATCATDGCSDKVYELMGHKGSYYLLLKHNDTIFNDGTANAPESQEGVKEGYFLFSQPPQISVLMGKLQGNVKEEEEGFHVNKKRVRKGKVGRPRNNNKGVDDLGQECDNVVEMMTNFGENQVKLWLA
ncbi:hypothetical protein POM88_017522 [Heracleum sosnowskyi]|uniref:Uncharacterized protein n=1 Tax=Heracleum sosnowskyi TaxID=360622 RepID=A0AAD8MY24_9APIA|nr:hypothetical protein POM88_017522 [Heracleum sosnowskyi]